MPLSVVGRAGPFRLMPHYVEWRLTGNDCHRERRCSAPGGRHLLPGTQKVGRQSVRRDARSLPFTAPHALTGNRLTLRLSGNTARSDRLRAVRLVTLRLLIVWRCLL
ncbi:hypothetical protein [Photorhabdus thracensis]|uniref:hypothetical protein n=1 Tax=Photorhabdus thracensis TaxID=230089 RepID=UPI0013012769|nr:hypothetical protein [Photorhabdus thracensis]